MGTEIQAKSNLLGHYSMRDLDDNSNSCSCPPYPRDNVLPNSHYYNGYFLRSAAKVYPMLDKDTLKQTMLEHEAIFRKQVLELHRVYTKQKELMNEFKRRGMFKGRMAVETSLASSPLASQTTSDDVAKWHSPGVPLVNSSYNLRPFTLAAEGTQSPASSSKVNRTQAADLLSPISFGVKSSEILESRRPSKVRRKMFDLQLPANQYIDDDELEQVKDDKFPKMFASPPNEDASADHGNGAILPRLHSGLRSIADLNKPLEVNETTCSAHVHHHRQSLAQSSNLGSNNEVASSRSVIASNNTGGWLSILDSGEGEGKISLSQGDEMQKLLVSEISMERNQLGRRGERSICGLATAESYNFPESVTPSHLAPRYLFRYPPNPANSWLKSVTNFERHGICSFNQKIPSQNGLSLETTSCSYVKVVQTSGIQGGSSDKQKLQSELPYQNGFHPDSSSCSREPPSQLCFVAYDHYANRSEDTALKEFVQNRSDETRHWHSISEVSRATRLIDLNATLLSGSSGGQVKVKKTEDHHKIPTWMLMEASLNNGADLRQVDLNASVLGGTSSAVVSKGRTMEDHPKISSWLKSEKGFGSEDHSSANCDDGRKNETGRDLEGNKMLSRSIASVSYYDRINSGQCPRDKKIPGFRISEKGASRPSEGTVSDYDNDRKTRLLDINLPCDSVPEFAKPSSPGYFVADKGKDVKGSHCIDLNLVISEDEVSTLPYVPMAKGVPCIDLEVPAAPDEEFVFVYGSEVVEENCEKSSRLVDKGMVSAAEAIVAISATIRYGFSLDQISFSAGCMEDPLNWFADVTVSCLNKEETRSAAVVSLCKQTWRQDGEITSEDFDDYELMTLKLTEMKSEDYFPKPFVPDIPAEDVSVANPTSIHPRRGQSRRGRPRRDFQRDILPGLASLSRHDVREDLQTFGGLMRATGQTWQSGLARRNSGNGSARGRRRTSATFVMSSQSTPIYAPPLLVQHQSAFEESSLTSWGKTTRRPLRQRCPVSNTPSIPVVQL